MNLVSYTDQDLQERLDESQAQLQAAREANAHLVNDKAQLTAELTKVKKLANGYANQVKKYSPVCPQYN